jgi:hypothetical protein
LADRDRFVAASPAAARAGIVAGAISMPNISERSSLAIDFDPASAHEVKAIRRGE